MKQYELIKFEQRTVNSSMGLNELEIKEAEEVTLVPDQETMQRVRSVLVLAGFKMERVSLGDNLPTETWIKNRTIVFSDHSRNLAKDILHDEFEAAGSRITKLKYDADAAWALSEEKEYKIKRLTDRIENANLWKRIKYLFGGKL